MTWYYESLDTYEIIVDITNLTNEMLDEIDIITDEKIYNELCEITGVNPTLDINKLMEKLDNFTQIRIHTQNLKISRLPLKLITYIDCFNNDVIEFPPTCKNYYFVDRHPIRPISRGGEAYFLINEPLLKTKHFLI